MKITSYPSVRGAGSVENVEMEPIGKVIVMGTSMSDQLFNVDVKIKVIQ